VESAREVMVVDHVVAVVWTQNDRYRMSAEKLALLLLRFVLPPMLTQVLALSLDLHHSNRHLGWTEREDWNGLKDRLARIRHGLNLRLSWQSSANVCLIVP
jgi:hypothetical protein